jgi:hypothetical protein
MKKIADAITKTQKLEVGAKIKFREENLVFGMGAETREECEEMLERLTQGRSDISHRNRVELNIEKYLNTMNRKKRRNQWNQL